MLQGAHVVSEATFSGGSLRTTVTRRGEPCVLPGNHNGDSEILVPQRTLEASSPDRVASFGSTAMLASSLAGLTPTQQQAIAGGNAAALYGFDLEP